jgi:tetratricopeptide (TPR) repeat protein
MRNFIKILSFFLICYLVLTACKNKQPDPELSNLELLRGDLIMCSGKEFGEVSFSLSCKTSVRAAFDLAVSLLHSFEYEEAEKAFVKVIDADPDCAMAYWGVAMSIYNALWAPPDDKKLKKGAKILEIAESIPKTEREKEYLDAIGMYFKDWETLDAKTRALKVEKKMEEIYTKYIDDTEAAIFYALTLTATAEPTDKNYTNQRKAGKILETLLPNHPNHPGITHYIIHSYDNPVLAEKALPVARKYADIAPGSAHAQHMPSHIFTRLGLWDESITSNLNSISAAKCYAEAAGIEGHWDEELHGLDYLVYAYLQKGDNKKAIERSDYLKTIKKVYPENFKGAYSMIAIPARIALENKDWQTAATLDSSYIDFPIEKFPWQKSIFHFTKALGATHLGNKVHVQKEIEILEDLRQKLIDLKKQYEADQVLIEINATKAWLHFANGKNNDAVTLMREAADMEDNTSKRPVTPGEVLPARELLGDMFLAMNKPKEALDAYKKNLEDHPNRFNGIYGAALASKKSGDQKQALLYYDKLINLTESVESARPEIAEAKKALGKI